jgi:hypothetical protein
MKNKYTIYRQLFCISIGLIVACTPSEKKQFEEQISIQADTEEPDSLVNSVEGNATMKQISTFPNNVILTGMPNHRLVSVYKSRVIKKEGAAIRISKYYSTENDGSDEWLEHYMPGIDILYGYNLLNLAHYDLQTEKSNYLFNHPVLVKTLYYPSFVQDSINKIPVNRAYYLVSVYDEDTNHDSLISKKDLRRFYYFDASTYVKKKLIADDYSVVKSQYDSKNDAMYVFAVHDENKNGMKDVKEPTHIFWINLKTPDMAKRLY